MASVATARPTFRHSATRAAKRGGTLAGALALLAATVAAGLALASYHVADPSFNTAADGGVANWLGSPGAWAADVLLSLIGPPAALLLPLGLIAGVRLARGVGVGPWRRGLALALGGLALLGVALSLLRGGAVAGLPAGWGGGVGLLGAGVLDMGLARVGVPALASGLRIAAIVLIGGGGLALWIAGLGLEAEERAWLVGWRTRRAAPEADDRIDAPIAPAPIRNKKPESRRPAQPEPLRDAAVVHTPDVAPAAVKAPPKRQSELPLGPYSLPPVTLLKEPDKTGGVTIDKAALDRNARLLETVLDDFKVKGHIVAIRPGPVVTMYELEPESGIKASRVVALADDIARNMSAMSARVAVIPGRTVIGIELPNKNRESVLLRELIESHHFAEQNGLPIILGKNIAGDPVVADLAPMPHLLIAGTTGSGKSVGLNTMILSLLYRHTPETCRMIMIDPKMLELSIYDDIPHLLSPVVTDPPKAVRALKWAVEQMEDRYRMMTSVSVRNLASFNETIRSAKAKNKPITRRVQTGYDSETGQPIYEEEKLDFEPLPQIVVIVDELADLMMTAGKEVEFLIQRLAQKARAAGIHLIMATQRPSVDVITGVIKANLPTRISFQVTSKIDSRTILGEQGAEQLLGKGDMLYMPGGKQIARVHGPFVSDEEVREVADHWRAQGRPDYISAVTEEPLEGGYELEGAPTGPDDPQTTMYRQAVQLVVENRKASTSWVQRQLRVGYNSGARLIERMEKDGVVSTPDHVGRREVLLDVGDLPDFWRRMGG